MQSVVIATPTNDGRVFVAYTMSLIGSLNELAAAKIAHEVKIEPRASLISAARNKIASQFLTSAHTDLVFIDSDIGWKPPDLVRLLSHQVPVVAAMYRNKSSNPEWAADFDVPTDKTALFEARSVGAGFLRIRRNCIEALAKAHPELRYTASDKTTRYALFDPFVGVGEDYSFCRRWRELGGKIMIDPTIQLRHWGLTAFVGALEAPPPAQRSTKV